MSYPPSRKELVFVQEFPKFFQFEVITRTVGIQTQKVVTFFLQMIFT